MGLGTGHEVEEGLSPFLQFLIYTNYAVFLIFGYLGDFLAWLINDKGDWFKISTKPGYAPLYVAGDFFYLRWLYGRISDAWNRPITGVPGTWIDVLERTSTDMNRSYTFTGKKIRCLNMGSYNYLGFADNSGPIIEEDLKALGKYSTSTCAPSIEGGCTAIHKELEQRIAEFVGKESAIIFEMGYATNSTTIPALVKKGGLVLSDCLNHASLVMGLRASGATVRLFKHNDTADLERVLRRSLAEGQPKTGQPWSMVVIVVEGIYSMEGVICKLPEIIRIKKKYKAYLYVDEAHSIGALGPRGRGVCDYFGVSPSEVDVLMGTFTKSFGSVGGYVAASKPVIDFLRTSSFGMIYSTSMSPVCAQQTLSALNVIMGKDGTDTGKKKLLQLRENSNYFRSKLKEMGFIIFGSADSPIIPLMLYHPTKFIGFSTMLLARGIAAVVVAFPATDKNTGRARFCLSAGHTREDLDFALKEISEAGDKINLKYLAHKNKAVTSS